MPKLHAWLTLTPPPSAHAISSLANFISTSNVTCVWRYPSGRICDKCQVNIANQSLDATEIKYKVRAYLQLRIFMHLREIRVST